MVRKKRLVAGIGAVLLAVGLAVSSPAVASAETHSSSCKGTYVTTKTVKNSHGTVIGKLGVYRDGNYMCAIGVKAGPVYGVSTFTSMGINSTKDWGYDGGNFRYQTDAIRVYAPEHYIWVDLSVNNRSGYTFSGAWKVYG